jgi:hypothetical protein
MGLAEENSRLVCPPSERDPIDRNSCSSSSSLDAIGGPGTSRPSTVRSIVGSQPSKWMSSTSSRASSGASRPSPSSSASTAAKILSSVATAGAARPRLASCSNHWSYSSRISFLVSSRRGPAA